MYCKDFLSKSNKSDSKVGNSQMAKNFRQTQFLGTTQPGELQQRTPHSRCIYQCSTSWYISFLSPYPSPIPLNPSPPTGKKRVFEHSQPTPRVKGS
ncbi:hypothetical protein CEXT_447741 [Caerostris extrusa]|uniref:Uncharacterized protein n=1 Tax=Caerostris extrusa TaxID=172846 RepID=A0AAV4V123_CAEEX|nr:hypothetical protein CEXT_447741 [Caerostris extrusa]